MPNYVDGYVLPVPRKNMPTYRRMARLGAKLWMEHGALSVRECVGENLKTKNGISFAKQVKLKAGETVVFSWIEFKSRKDRDRVNAKVMTDPRLEKMMAGEAMPFDPKRMIYGGFQVIVSAD